MEEIMHSPIEWSPTEEVDSWTATCDVWPEMEGYNYDQSAEDWDCWFDWTCGRQRLYESVEDRQSRLIKIMEKVPVDCIDKDLADIDIYYISIELVLDVDLLNRYYHRWNWSQVSSNPSLNEEIVDAFINQLDWDELSISLRLSIPLIWKYQPYWNWSLLMMNRSLTSEILEEFRDILENPPLEYPPLRCAMSVNYPSIPIDYSSLGCCKLLRINGADHTVIMDRARGYELCQSCWKKLVSYHPLDLRSIEELEKVGYGLDWRLLSCNPNLEPGVIQSRVDLLRELHQEFINYSNDDVSKCRSNDYWYWATQGMIDTGCCPNHPDGCPDKAYPLDWVKITANPSISDQFIFENSDLPWDHYELEKRMKWMNTKSANLK